MEGKIYKDGEDKQGNTIRRANTEFEKENRPGGGGARI